jgi:hypothetical protein
VSALALLLRFIHVVAFLGNFLFDSLAHFSLCVVLVAVHALVLLVLVFIVGAIIVDVHGALLRIRFLLVSTVTVEMVVLGYVRIMVLVVVVIFLVNVVLLRVVLVGDILELHHVLMIVRGIAHVARPVLVQVVLVLRVLGVATLMDVLEVRRTSFCLRERKGQ